MLPRKMLPRSCPDGIHIAFDDHRLVNNAGLILPVTLAQHLGLPQLVQQRLDLGNAPGRANTGDKIATLVASALAGGDCIDDADVLRTGGTAPVLEVWPETIGRVLHYAKQTYFSHIRRDNVCNTFQKPVITSVIDVKKIAVWGESGFPARFLEVWPESHWPGFALRQADVLQSYTA